MYQQRNHHAKMNDESRDILNEDIESWDKNVPFIMNCNYSALFQESSHSLECFLFGQNECLLRLMRIIFGQRESKNEGDLFRLVFSMGMLIHV